MTSSVLEKNTADTSRENYHIDNAQLWDYLHKKSMSHLSKVPGTEKLCDIMLSCYDLAKELAWPDASTEAYRYALRNKYWQKLTSLNYNIDDFSDDGLQSEYYCTTQPSSKQVAITGCSNNDALPNGVSLINIFEALESDSMSSLVISCLEESLSKIYHDAINNKSVYSALTLYNASCWLDGSFLLIDDKINEDQLIKVSAKIYLNNFSPKLNIIYLNPGVAANILNEIKTISSKQPTSNPSMQIMLNTIVCAEGSRLSLYDAESHSADVMIDKFSTVIIKENSTAEIYPLQSGACWSRQKWLSNVEGNKSLVALYAVDVSEDDTQHHEFRHRIIHNHSNTNSTHYFRGLVQHAATSLAQGDVVVRPGVAKIDSVQDAAYLLSHDMAKAIALPALTIDSEDVKCSHGATVGAIDNEALFYLRSRGIEESVARNILSRSFLAAIFDNYKHTNLAEYFQDKYLPKQQEAGND